MQPWHIRPWSLFCCINNCPAFSTASDWRKGIPLPSTYCSITSLASLAGSHPQNASSFTSASYVCAPHTSFTTVMVRNVSKSVAPSRYCWQRLLIKAVGHPALFLSMYLIYFSANQMGVLTSTSAQRATKHAADLPCSMPSNQTAIPYIYMTITCPTVPP